MSILNKTYVATYLFTGKATYSQIIIASCKAIAYIKARLLTSDKLLSIKKFS